VKPPVDLSPSARNDSSAGDTLTTNTDKATETSIRARSSMRQVAKRAGVAMSSVSRVLSGHPDVSRAMRQRVLAAVEELNYQPDLLAQSLRRRETLSVGFVIGDIANPLLADIVKGAETVLQEAGYSVLLTNSLGDSNVELANLRVLEQRRVDGLILSLANEDHEPTWHLLERLVTPIVIVDRDVPASLQASRALSNHAQGMEDAIAHLLELGHRKIGLILGNPTRPARERRLALERAYERAGLPPTYRIIEGEFSVEHGERGARELLDDPEPPTAIIAGGNQMTIGALRVISDRGIELGSALSFVGCDDVHVTELYQPPISVVRRDTEELGRVAAALLLAQMSRTEESDEPAPPPPVEDVLLPTEYVRRASCAPSLVSSRR
jgi:LacI family transcriptional regulator